MKTIKKKMPDIEQEIDKNFKELVQEDTGWITAVTAGVTPDVGKPVQYRKKGSKVMIRGGGTFPVAVGSTFLILPVEMKPVGQAVYFDALVRDSNTTNKCFIQVLTDGSCKIITNNASSNPVFLDGLEFETT